MSDNACTILLNLINLAVRMMPIFVCLGPKHRNRENIAAVSAYLWVIMVSMQSLSHTPQEIFFVPQGTFSCLFFPVLLTSFQGSLLKKAFLYVSTWLFAVPSTSLNEFAAWVLDSRVPLPYGQVYVLVSLVSVAGFCPFVRFWLRGAVDRLFSQLSTRSCSLFLTYPCVPLVVLTIGTNSIFSPRSLASRRIQDILSFMALCAIILVLYIMILGNTLEITYRRKAEGELQFARQPIGKQGEHYNQTLDYIKRVRVIKHDFQHHIRALQDVEKEEQSRYPKNLKEELDRMTQMIFCQNQAVNRLLQEYAAGTRREDITFEIRADLSAHVPMDDLTLCIVIGNLLENTFEACRRVSGAHFIRVRTRWMNDHLMMTARSSYSRQVTQRGGRVLSSRKDGGLGMLSIQRILNHPGDEFSMDYGGTTFTAMVEIAGRAVAE